MNPILLMGKQRLRETRLAALSVVPGPATLTSPGNLLEMSILEGSIPDLLNQKLGPTSSEFQLQVILVHSNM